MKKKLVLSYRFSIRDGDLTPASFFSDSDVSFLCQSRYKRHRRQRRRPIASTCSYSIDHSFSFLMFSYSLHRTSQLTAPGFFLYLGPAPRNPKSKIEGPRATGHDPRTPRCQKTFKCGPRSSPPKSFPRPQRTTCGPMMWADVARYTSTTKPERRGGKASASLAIYLSLPLTPRAECHGGSAR